MKSPGHISLIDPEIRQLVIELNRNGFKTVGSCAGHKGTLDIITKKPIKGNGYINIRGSIPKDPIERLNLLNKLIPIFMKYKCFVTGWDNDHDRNEYDVRFDPIGQPWSKWKKVRPDGFWGKFYGKQKSIRATRFEQ
jgi:hypothetical protein